MVPHTLHQARTTRNGATYITHMSRLIISQQNINRGPRPTRQVGPFRGLRTINKGQLTYSTIRAITPNSMITISTPNFTVLFRHSRNFNTFRPLQSSITSLVGHLHTNIPANNRRITNSFNLTMSRRNFAINRNLRVSIRRLVVRHRFRTTIRRTFNIRTLARTDLTRRLCRTLFRSTNTSSTRRVVKHLTFGGRHISTNIVRRLTRRWAKQTNTGSNSLNLRHFRYFCSSRTSHSRNQ